MLILGRELTQLAEQQDIGDIASAALDRDGLIIMMLICRPLRLHNFAGLRLGEHLAKPGDSYTIRLPDTETKNHDESERPLPAFLTPFIDPYLERYRTRLLRGAENDNLWTSRMGRPMPDSGVYAAVRSRTKAACGIGIPPHRFRDIAVASMGETDPQLVWLALPLLQHRDRRIAEKHYNQARDASAVGVWQDYVIAKRRTSKAKNQRSSQDS